MRSDQVSLPLQDVTVIGAGPAGTAAAIYAARKGLTVTLIADRVGGQAKDAAYLDNLVTKSTLSGVEFACDLLSGITEHEITLRQHIQVQKLELSEISKLYLSTGELIQSKTVIIATGAQWRKLDVPGELENIGNGVSYCPHCHGPNFIDKDIAVIGDDSQALQAALDLARTARTVSLVSKNKNLAAHKTLIEQIRNQENISTLLNTAVVEVVAKNRKVMGIKYQEKDSDGLGSLHLHGVFVQMGSTPNSQFLRGVLELNERGEVLIDQHCRTSEPGIYACGDVSSVPYKQVVIAMGEGAKASLSAAEHLLA